MIPSNPSYPSKTPIATLAKTGADITMNGGEALVDFHPKYPVSIHRNPEDLAHEIQIKSPQHDPITVRTRGWSNMDSFDVFWAVAEVVLEECQRVGDWLVGRDPVAEVGLDIDEDERDSLRFHYEHEVDQNIPGQAEYNQYVREQERQEERAKFPLEGTDIPPADPEDYYPWLNPHTRPILYTYKADTNVDCPICGDYGRHGDFADGIRCKTHGGFITCWCRNGSNWVRADSSGYEREFAPRAGWSDIEQVKVVRDGYLLTLDYEPIRANRVTSDDIRRHGFDTGSRRGIAHMELFEGSVVDDGHLLSRDGYEAGDKIIFAKYEIVAKKFTDEVVSLDTKPWASETSLQENFRTYYRHANSDPYSN